jgi:AcrR family transcriptional regulator
VYAKFNKLSKEKQNKIIDVALREFGENGYSHGSTNEIVKKAGISKGALFNYFGSKKDLYFYLLDYCIQILEDKIYSKPFINDPDLLVRMKEIAIEKIKVFEENPEIYYFLVSFYKDSPVDIEREFNERSIKLKEKAYKKLFEEIDYSKFKDDIDVKKTVQIINWSLNSFSDEMMKKFKIESASLEEANNLVEELEEYILVFRKAFYKN